MEKKRIGNYQFAYEFTDADGKKAIGISTPADYARMHDWMNAEKRKGEWLVTDLLQRADEYHVLMVAKREGLVESDEPTSENVFNFLNDWDYEDITYQYREVPDANPPEEEKEGDQAAS